jgi:hypothetical protein
MILEPMSQDTEGWLYKAWWSVLGEWDAQGTRGIWRGEVPKSVWGALIKDDFLELVKPEPSVDD